MTTQDFSTLFETHYERLYAYIASRVADRVTAEDITAAAFERAYRNFDRFDPQKASFATWLFTIGRNLTINHYAKYKRRPQRVGLEAAANMPVSAPSPEQAAIRKEQQQALLKAMDILSERDQEILQLRFFGRLSNRNIAEMLDMNERTVSVVILRALKKLNVKLR